jgi:anti-anti-sigma factor
MNHGQENSFEEEFFVEVELPQPRENDAGFSQKSNVGEIIRCQLARPKNRGTAPRPAAHTTKKTDPPLLTKEIPVAHQANNMLSLGRTSPTESTAMAKFRRQPESSAPLRKNTIITISSPVQSVNESARPLTDKKSKNCSFTISFVERIHDSDYDVFSFAGIIDQSQQKSIENFFSQAVAQGGIRILCDLSGVSSMSSSGWSALVSQLQHLRKLGGDLILCGMQDYVADSFRLLELDKLFSVCRSIAEGRKYIEEKLTEAKKSIPSRESRIPAEADRLMPLEDKLSLIIAENPYFGNRQILKRLRSADYGSTEIGFRELFFKLRAMNLGTKEKRYRYFRSL